jgi:hypothetical protein
VSWAERWAKAKENHARVSTLRARTKTFMIGAILAGVCGASLYSDAKHQISGKPSTATLMEHIKQCTMEYQRIGEEKRNEKWPCELAEELQRRVGQNKIKISRDFIARVQFPLADGRMHQADVDDIQLGSYGLAIGSTLPVFYAPGNPGDVRAVMSWERAKAWLIVLAVGVGFLALALGGPLATMFGWVFGGRTTRGEEETVPARSEQLAPTSTRMSEFSDSKSQRGPNIPANAPRASFGMRNR